MVYEKLLLFIVSRKAGILWIMQRHRPRPQRFVVIDLQAIFLFAAFSNLAGAFLWLRSQHLFLLVDLESKLHPREPKMSKMAKSSCDQLRVVFFFFLFI